MCPWHPNAHGSLGFQGNSELDGPIARRWRKVGLVGVLQWLWHSFTWPFFGGAVWVRVQLLDFAEWVEGETQPRWVALGLKQPGALLVELVDLDTTTKFPM